MNNTELLEQIKSQKENQNDDSAKTAEKRIRFLIVQIQENRYAFHAEHIKEILIDEPVYFVPFVPPYVKGFINRHGEPYTVFDLNVLFQKEHLDSNMFLISNFKGDQIAFIISDVVEIAKIPESKISFLTNSDKQKAYFEGSLNSGNTEIFILNIEKLTARLENDLELF